MIWMRTSPGFCSLALCFIVCVGCTRSVRPEPTPAAPSPEARADFQSSRPGVLREALEMRSGSDENEQLAMDVFESDGEVSGPAGKPTRWLRADASAPPMDANTPLRCELRYQPQSAELQVDAWSGEQKPLPEHHQISPGLYVTEAFLAEPAPVFLRVRALRPSDAARFTLRCTWQRFVGHEERGRGGRWRYRLAPGPDPERYDRGTEGRIIFAYRENGRFVLRIDKGETAGVKVGSEGNILSGKSGREPLEGGFFKVVKVLEKDCIAESQIRSIGKNTRVVLFVQ